MDGFICFHSIYHLFNPLRGLRSDTCCMLCSYFVCTFCDRAHWVRGVGMCSRRPRLSLLAWLRHLSSLTKRNWIPQKPTQAVRFNRAFKHSHWPLWVGFVCDYSSRNRSAASFPWKRPACVLDPARTKMNRHRHVRSKALVTGLRYECSLLAYTLGCKYLLIFRCKNNFLGVIVAGYGNSFEKGYRN